ncbi:arylsulfatase [Paludisphaera rhizosphaerae]|uniref:arylsulfatase n=1 Tax=Paludisphaera rhizosphaerae TaxID=2711216 RepID=UPI0013ECCE9E|nr:arylsulfatase [Paludisphaera rhizosphaerae]
MNIRRSIVLTAATTAIALVALGNAAEAAAPGRPPNIVFILADDLGYGHVGCYGQTKIRTPNIDALAKEGMRFTQFYSGAGVCAPARSTLLTGLHTGRTPVRNNGLDRHLDDADVTIAEVLKKAGYVTGGFGKWGLGRDETPGVALKQGFDVWFGHYSQTHAHFHYPAFLMNGLEREPLPANLGKKRGTYAPDAVHEQALAFIEANRDKPFFAYLPYTLPHVELIAPPADRQAYEGRWPKINRADPRPGYIGSDDAYADFAGMVSRVDAQVGEVAALLKRLGIEDDTILIFTSDNGPQPGAWLDIFVEFFDGNGPSRGAKGSFYEGGVRVPMIVRWPGRIKPGSTSDLIAYFPDVLPTLADLAGASNAVPPGLDGLSFAPTLLGDPAAQKPHEYLYWEEAGAKQNTIAQAVRLGRWKAVRPGPAAAWELYDLDADPGEASNLAAAHPEVLERVAAACREAHTPERPFPAAPRESAADYVK